MAEKSLFTAFSQKASFYSGHPYSFLTAAAIVVVWACSGPMFDFGETWQLIINTGTTIITFLMVFLIQSTQNRDTAAMQIKLDELIRATEGTHTSLLDLEELDEATLEKIRKQYRDIAHKGRERINQGKTDTSIPSIKLKHVDQTS